MGLGDGSEGQAEESPEDDGERADDQVEHDPAGVDQAVGQADGDGQGAADEHLPPRQDDRAAPALGAEEDVDGRDREGEHHPHGGRLDADLPDQQEGQADEGEHRDDGADDEGNPLVGVLHRLVDHPVDGRRDEAARHQRDQRRRGCIGGGRHPDHDGRHHRRHQHRPGEDEGEVAELDAAGVADSVLVLDRPEHRRLLQRPQGLPVAAREHGDQERHSRGQVVGTEIGVGDEAGEEEDVGVADHPHREHERDPDRALAVDRDRLAPVPAELPAAAQDDERHQHGQPGSDRLTRDRALDRQPGDQQRHGGGEDEHRLGDLDGDVRIGAPLDPDRDR